jgi:hypothetical protein
MEEEEKLYPKIINANLVTTNTKLEPTAPIINEDTTVNFRLHHITKIQKDLQDELSNYSRCRRRYNSAFNTLSNVHSVVSFGTIATSATGLGLIASGIGAIAGIVLEGVSVGFGLGSLVSDIFLKKINKKLQKHTAISQLANSKITSIQKLISTALEDGNISDSEFKQIIDNYENYQTQKQSIQSKMKNNSTNINQLKNHFLEEGKKLGMEEASKKLNTLLGK